MSTSPTAIAPVAEMNTPSVPNPKKTGRPPNEAYIELMRPDEDWRTMADGAERRKIQNRLAQRAYRRNLREKNKEVEKLKQKLKQFEGQRSRGMSASSSDSAVPDSYHETDSHPSESSGSSDWSGHSAAPAFPDQDTSGDLQFMFQNRSIELDDLDSQLLDMAPGVDTMDFDSSNIGSDSSHGSAAGTLNISLSPDIERRSRSRSIKSPEQEIFVSHGADFGTGIQDLLVDSNNHISDMMGMTTAVMDESFPLSFTTPLQSPYLQLPMEEYPLQNPDSTLNPHNLDMQRTTPDPRWAPDANSSLLHFAVAGGQIETLKLLLQHQQPQLDMQDSEGFTPIQRAIMLGRTDMVALLLECRSRAG